MAHLSDGTLRLAVDEAEALSSADSRHLEGCAECQTRRAAAAKDARAVSQLLAVPEVQVDVAMALRQVRAAAPNANIAPGFRMPRLRPRSRPFALALVTAVAVFGLIATVIAQDGTIFAPNSVTPVPVTVADLQALSQLSGYGSITWTAQPQLQFVASASEAESLTGLHAPIATDLPAGVPSTVTYAAMTKAVAVFTFNASTAATTAAASGKTLPPLPSGMDGAQLTVTVGPAIGEVYGDLQAPTSTSDISLTGLPRLVVLESTIPTVTSTQLSAAQIERYLLSLPGLSPDLDSAIRAISNPSATLPIPIPIQYATSTTVTVQQVQGVALGDNTGLGAGVLWVKHGIVYGVAGSIKESDAINIANHLQ